MQQGLFEDEPPSKVAPTEREKLDAIMVTMEATRGFLIETAREIAFDLVRKHGTVTSVEVFRAMRDQGYEALLKAVDPRWMGAVFRTGGWVRDGYKDSGSHCRPVSVWKLP